MNLETEQFAKREVEPVRFRKCIVVLAGLPLSGKTTLGEKLAELSNFTYLDVDKARRGIFNEVAVYSELGEQFTMLNAYQRNHEVARDLLAEGQPVILGAIYSREIYHEMIRSLAQKTNAPLRVFLLNAPDEKIEQRLNKRPVDNPSNLRSIEHYRGVKIRYKPITEANIEHIDTSLPLEQNVEQVFSSLVDLQAKDSLS